jgi:hypothetical protein
MERDAFRDRIETGTDVRDLAARKTQMIQASPGPGNDGLMKVRVPTNGLKVEIRRLAEQPWEYTNNIDSEE